MYLPGEPRSQTRIQSVSRAIALLLAVAESPEGATAKVLADKVGLALPTSYHLLTTLWAEGMLNKDESRVFRLGPNAAVIADAYQRSNAIPQSYRVVLDQVARATGETAYLGAWRNRGVHVLDTAEGDHAVRVVGLNAGFTEDVHARASGKLLMAFLPEELVQSLLDRVELRRITPTTITKKAELLREFQEIRDLELAFDREEFQMGVTCVAAPIWCAGRVVACITISAPTNRFYETEDHIVNPLRKGAESLRDH